MPESQSWAIATQQAHKLGKTPKGYGTSEGRAEAKAKFDKPKSEYKKTAALSPPPPSGNPNVINVLPGQLLTVGGQFKRASAAFADELMRISGVLPGSLDKPPTW